MKNMITEKYGIFTIHIYLYHSLPDEEIVPVLLTFRCYGYFGSRVFGFSNINTNNETNNETNNTKTNNETNNIKTNNETNKQTANKE